MIEKCLLPPADPVEHPDRSGVVPPQHLERYSVLLERAHGRDHGADRNARAHRQLVADLGGMNGSPEQWVEMNRLGLSDGSRYLIHFFTTNRAGNTRLHLVTSIALNSVGVPEVWDSFD